jgi:xanthine dehydrogenase YagT iron-sulfur-binding subunit
MNNKSANESTGNVSAPLPAKSTITLTVNGAKKQLEVAPWTTLLDLLREYLNLTGTKKGCDHGQCGACTVLVDGKRINSCLTLAVMKDGAEVTTIEGLAAGETLHPLQQAFIEHDAFQCSTAKEGSTKADNGEIGYPPLLAVWAAEGELLFSHLRRGSASTARNILWFLRETDQRVPTTASKSLRADSGFYSKGVVEWCAAQGFIFTLTAEQTGPLLEAMAALPEHRWRLLPEYDLAEVAELRYQPTGWSHPYRYVVKRELAVRKTGELYWKYHATVTNDERRAARALRVWHLPHATMENAIKAQKSGLGLEKLPTRKFHANWAYLLLGHLAFTRLAWFKRLVLPPVYPQATIKTIRPQLLNLAGKIVHTARRCFLMLSDQYRYQAVWRFAIGRLAHLQFG